MSHLLQDLRYAIRTLGKSPGFTLVAAAALALGIGANTSIFSFVNAFLLRPLPFEEPERLVHVWGTVIDRGFTQDRVSAPDFLDWRSQAKSFEDLAAFNYTGEVLESSGRPEMISGGQVSANAFQLLGVRPLLGRLFEEGEDRLASSRVALISERFWRRRLGGDPDILGKPLGLNGSSHTIVGVLSDRFRFPLPTTELWIPRPLDSQRYDRETRFLQVFGRLRQGVTVEQAQLEMDQLTSRLRESHPQENKSVGASIVPLRNALNFAHDIIQPMSLILVAAVGFVLLIACANVANLLLARAGSRQREIAIRSALGAKRRRLVSQLLTESALIALLGGVVGVGIAILGTRAFASFIPDQLYKVGEISIDLGALAFALALSLATTLLFGLAPALRGSRLPTAESLKEGSGGAGIGRRNRRLNSALVVAEISLAIILLVGASLMIRSLLNLQAVDLGFQKEGVLTLRMSLPIDRYPDQEKTSAFHQAVVERVESLGAVVAAATVNYLPLNHETNTAAFEVAGVASPERPWQANLLHVTPRYFEVMGIPLLQGRPFEKRDDRDAPPVALISQSMAERYWPDSTALGDRIRLEGQEAWVTVVGIVGDARQVDISRAADATVYLTQIQSPWRYLRVLARVQGHPESFVHAIQSEIWRLDAGLPLTEVKTLDGVVDDFLLPQRSLAQTLAVLTAGALLLAAAGIYGLMAYYVSQRVREVGIRIALGAKRGDVLRLILSSVMRLTAGGLLVGMTGALLLTSLMSSLLYQVKATDPSTLLGAPILLALIATAAGVIPAYKASRIDPIRTLRME